MLEVVTTLGKKLSSKSWSKMDFFVKIDFFPSKHAELNCFSVESTGSSPAEPGLEGQRSS